MVSVLTRGGDAGSTATVCHSKLFKTLPCEQTSVYAVLVILIILFS